MRSAEERLVRLVCGEHCRFFQPWRAEERRCGGQAWLLRRVQADPRTLDTLEKLRAVRPVLLLRSDGLLLRTVCTRCEYYPYSCRYRNPTRPAGGAPCGGIVALDLLLDRGLLAAEELYDPPQLREVASS